MKKILRYPLKNIGEYDDYFKIDVVEYKAPGLVTSSPGSFALRTTEQALAENIKNSNVSIILPMPQQITDGNTADWGPGELNPLSATVVSAANNIINSKEPINAGVGEVNNLLKKVAGVAQDGTTQNSLAAFFSGEVAKSLLGQNVNFLSRATGVVLNQNVELLFNGVQLRQAFSFAYDLIPRSREESERIKDIIRTFKKEMTPARGDARASGGGLFVRSPNVFNLTYMSGGNKHPFLHSFKPCALTAMSVDYTGAGTYATYSDATPVHLKIALQFQELSIIYAEDYTENDIGVGY